MGSEMCIRDSYMAKQMIRMICKLGDLINNDPAVREKLRVVYL